MMLVRAYKEAFGAEMGTSAGARALGDDLEGPIRIRVSLATCCCRVATPSSEEQFGLSAGVLDVSLRGGPVT